MAQAKTRPVDPSTDHNAASEMAQCWMNWGTPRKRWVGFFDGYETALAWVKNTPNPTQYTINNSGPSALVSEARDRARAAVPEERVSRPVSSDVHRAYTPFRSEVVTEDVKALRKDARVRLDKHKKDEAADIAAGRTEAV